jgi:homoserine kinase
VKSVAFSPATVANVAVGFDILGFAIQGLGEHATVERIKGGRGVEVMPVAGFPDLPTEASRNTATAGLVQLLNDKKFNFGLRVSLDKQIPIGSGLGGSAASAVAAVVAANALLPRPLKNEELFEYAMIGEEVASGSRHGDNVAPCLLGGLVYVRGSRWTPIKYPRILRCVVVLPQLTINTKSARGILSPTLPLAKVIEQTANLAGFLLGCAQQDTQLIGESLRDVLIEPQRMQLIPGFAQMQEAALRQKALGCSISGSGPAIFALTDSDVGARKVEREWRKVAAQIGLPLHGIWCSPIARRGARVLRVRR